MQMNANKTFQLAFPNYFFVPKHKETKNIIFTTCMGGKIYLRYTAPGDNES